MISPPVSRLPHFQYYDPAFIVGKWGGSLCENKQKIHIYVIEIISF